MRYFPRRVHERLELRLPLGHHQNVFVIESCIEVGIKTSNFYPPGFIDSRYEEVHDNESLALRQCEGMSPHFSPRSRAIKSTGNPSPHFPVKPQFDHGASSFVVGLWPHACAEAPCSSVSAFNLREAIAMEIG